MNTAIGVYDSHDLAIQAVLKLKESGHPVSQLTVMGLLETEKVDEEMHVTPINPLKPAGLGVAAVVGTTLGILTGIGIFAIPGVGFLFGAGAVVGAVGGFDFGLIGGGIIAALSSLGVKDEKIAEQYHKDLIAGKFLVVAHGSEEEVNAATAVLGSDSLRHSLPAIQ